MKPISKPFIWLCTALLLVAGLATRSYFIINERLKESEASIKAGDCITLNGDTSVEAFATILLTHGYVTDLEEARFIARHLIGSIRENGGQLQGLRDLSLREYGLKLDDAGLTSISPYPGLVLRAEEMTTPYQMLTPKAPVAEAGLSKKFTVRIKEGNRHGRTVTDTTWILIREHWNETILNNEEKIIDCISRDSVYAVVPISGKGRIWLETKSAEGNPRYYSAIPFATGYYFGTPRGTYKSHTRSFTFVRKQAVLPLLGEGVLKKAREDDSIVVRSADEFRDKYVATFALFIAAWLLAFFLLEAIDKKRGGRSEMRLLAVASILSGLGLITLFNVQDPLWGQLYAWDQLIKGLLLGLVLLLVFAFTDWIELFRLSRGRLLARQKGGLQGIWLAIAAISLLLTLICFGQGPGGTHINLPFVHIQGSPIIKLLILGYMAVAFAGDRDLLEKYNEKGQFWKKLAVISAILLLLAIIAIGQLAISDLGPFLVLAWTGILLMSIATKETRSMLIGTGIFALILFLVVRFIRGGSWLPYVVYLLWATGWCAYGYIKHGRIHGMALALSLSLLLAFHGGAAMDKLGLTDIASRLQGREKMASNVFNNEVVGGSQIAEGIWALARGGILGTPGTGLSATIPAGHTDLSAMALTESLGFAGFVLMMFLIGALIYLEINAGKSAGHPFAFGLCAACALSLGIQSCLLLFGNIGLVPMTGICMPLISYSGASTSVELACIGLVVGLSRKHDVKLQKINTLRYVRIAKTLQRTYATLAMIAVAVVAHYSVFARDKYLVKPGIFINKEGEMITLYNPIISWTQKQLLIGDIRDCKGHILASTDENGVRKYPYGAKLFFIVGDFNTKTLWGSAGKRPAGLLAEERFYSLVRGYETKPVKKSVTSHGHYSQFLPFVPLEKEGFITVEDYSGLVPLMKSKKKLEEWNANAEKRNIILTVDAELQSDLEDKMAAFVAKKKREGRLTDRSRIVVVAIKASDGSLLTSSTFPLANQDILRERARAKAYVYRDWAPGFKAISDMDLALVPYEPGSAGKTMTAGAGLIRFSVRLPGSLYDQMAYKEEIVDTSLGEPTGLVSLYSAIVMSSNVYFIKLAHKYGEMGLYPEMAEIFYAVGAGFGGSTPYVLYPDEPITNEESFKKQMTDFGSIAAKKYADYEASGKKHRLIDGEYQPAWGEGVVSVAPIALCRYISAIANDGKMMYPRYLTTDSVRVHKQILTAEEAHILQECMKGQAEGRFGDFSRHVGGKTGTPTRADKASTTGKTNDALYCFFVDADGTPGKEPISVVIRLERTQDYSRIAMQMAEEVVLPILRKKGYIL